MSTHAFHHDLESPIARLLAVDRAANALRRGLGVEIAAGADRIAAHAIETAGEPRLAAALGDGEASIVVAGPRLRALGLGGANAAGDFAAASLQRAFARDARAAARVRALADPTLAGEATLAAELHWSDAGRLERAAAKLAKLAGLLPACLIAKGRKRPIEAGVSYDAIEQQRFLSESSLRPVSEARVPLDGAENAKMIVFRPVDGGPEQIAIVVGALGEAPLCRLHSECFTGDFLGSLRCDCGDQLRGAVRRIGEEGAGVLLYLAHEGRGIGLANKLRAYELQDRGVDTVDANHQLGFEDDERTWLRAAAMLRHIGVERVRLLTNNPSKCDAMDRYGVRVIERLALAFPPNRHNATYLNAKAERSGHILPAAPGEDR